MLINCPKCGFSQPKDQYCAQCGVDMLSFRPKEESFLNKLKKNVALQILILILAAGYVGQSIFRSERPQQWVQKIAHFQGISKSTKTKSSPTEDSDEAAEFKKLNGYVSGSEKANFPEPSSGLEGMRNSEISLAKNDLAASANTSAQASTSLSSFSGQEVNSVNFKLTFAEVSSEMLNKWVTESSNLGLYQSLTDYSAGIINEFRKRGENPHQILKTANIRLAVGNTNSNLSGTMTDDGSQMVGLIAAIEYKSNENDLIHGSLSISRSNRQGSEVFPADFDLPKGAAFFIVGALKPESFAADKGKLIMPPFQIFKSPDFMAHKSEFIIIIEPEQK